MPRAPSCHHLGCEEWFESKLPSKMPGTCQPGANLWPGGSEYNRDMENNLTHHRRRESESMERKKYALSKEAGASPNLYIPSPQPINKSKKAPEPMLTKKKAITVDKYWAREEKKCQDKVDQVGLEAEHQEKEYQEATLKLAELRRLDKEDNQRLAKMKELKECEEKAKEEAARVELERKAQEEVAQMAAHAVESPCRDENNEELDYYDDFASQETAEMSSQEMVPTSNQDSSQWASQDTASMPSQDSTPNATTLGATGATLTENKTCLEDPTLKCTPTEKELQDPTFNDVLAALNEAPLGYLAVLAEHIKQIRNTKALRMPMVLLRALPRLPAPAGKGTEPDLPSMTTSAMV